MGIPILSALIFAAFFLVGGSSQALDESGYDIIVIGGQSNAVGVGRGAYRDAMKSYEIDRRIFQLGRDIEDCVNDEGRILPATDVLQHWLNCPRWGGVGFGMAFARRWAADPRSHGRKVLLIPGAYGGTTIKQWQDELWAALKSQIRRALQEPGRHRMVAFLWSQGESDFAACAFAPSSSNCAYRGGGAPVSQQWQERTLEVFKDFRALFNSEATAPILATGFVPAFKELRHDKDPQNPCRSSDGGVLDDPGCFASVNVAGLKLEFEETLRKIETDGAFERFGFVETAGTTSNGEVGAALKPEVLPLYWTEARIHFSAQGQIDLGERLWRAFQRKAP